MEGDPVPEQDDSLVVISIHSLRVEGDLIAGAGVCPYSDFNPLPPCGGRLDTVSKIADHIQFQSTPSVWRETQVAIYNKKSGAISIHSLRVEGDRRILTMQEEGAISIHSLRVEGDKYRLTVSGGGKISIHSLRVEGDEYSPTSYNPHSISIHSLRVEGDIGHTPR